MTDGTLGHCIRRTGNQGIADSHGSVGLSTALRSDKWDNGHGIGQKVKHCNGV